MNPRFIPPYESPDWSKWHSILSKEISDSADFDQMMTQLHGGNYDPKAFSNFLYSYYLGENESGVFGDIDPDVSINHRPETRRINKKELFASILPFIQGLVVKFPSIMYSFMMSKTDNNLSADQINKLPKDYIINELIENSAIYPLSIAKQPMTNIMIPRTHVTAILACAFFGLFDLYDCRGDVDSATFSNVNFLNFITKNNTSAFECVVNYFARVQRELPAGNVIIRRVNTSPKASTWSKNAPLSHVRLYTNMLAENSHANVQLVAHSSFSPYAGDEIDSSYVRFLIHPELFILPIFVENLTKNESLIVLGIETYSSVIYSDKAAGYNSIKYSGEYYDNVQRVRNGTPARTLIFVPALHNDNDHAGKYLDSFKQTLDIIHDAIQNVVPNDNSIPRFVVDISIGPWSPLQYVQLLLAASAVGNTRIHYHRNDMLESNKDRKIIQKIEMFMLTLSKHNAGMKSVISAYNKFSQDFRRDRDNNYGEYDPRALDIFAEISKRL